MDAIRIEKAGKCIKNNWIYKDVSVSFEQGKIHGLIGRNGAGKTMLLKSICGLTQVTTGKIWVNGLMIGTEIDIPDSIGAIIEVPGFLPNLSGLANLKYLAGLRKRIDEKRIRECMQLVGLQPENRKHVGKYSLGMRQRLGIAQAIMEEPDIILLDEPMNGLDSAGVEDIRKILIKLKDEGKTILLASHNKEDIDMLCDEVYKMENGKLYRENAIMEERMTWEESFPQVPDFFKRIVEETIKVNMSENEYSLMHLLPGAIYAYAYNRLSSKGFLPRSMQEHWTCRLL